MNFFKVLEMVYAILNQNFLAISEKLSEMVLM